MKNKPIPTNRQKNNETDRINIIFLSVFQLSMEKYTVFLCVLVTPTEKFILTSAGKRNAQPTWAWAALAFSAGPTTGGLCRGHIKAALQTLAPHSVSLPHPPVRRLLHFVRPRRRDIQFSARSPRDGVTPKPQRLLRSPSSAPSPLAPKWWRARLGRRLRWI